MNLIKNAWLDIAVTVLIAVAVLTGNEITRWAVMVYTPFMVLLKLAALRGSYTPSKIRPKETGVPEMVYHVLYALNVALLVFGGLRVSGTWWWVAACWILIWLLSAAASKGKGTVKAEKTG